MSTIVCPVCKSSGALGPFVCGRCDGAGRIWVGRPPHRAPWTASRVGAFVASVALAAVGMVAFVRAALEVLP